MIVYFLVIVTACQDKTQEPVADESDVDVEKGAEEEVEEELDEEPDEKRVDEFVEMSAEVHVDEDKIVVEGQTNLPENASLRSRAVANNWAQIDFQDSADVQSDGSFEFEFPSVSSNTEVIISLAPNDIVTDLFGENFEKAEGPHKRITDDRDEFDILMEFFIDGLKEKPYTLNVDVPEWEVPDDYGEPDIWMDVDYEITHRHIIFKGKSNLVEGSSVGGNLRADLIEPFAFEHTEVLPDGSFILRVPYHDLKKGLYMPIECKPSNHSHDLVLDHYGEQGEKLEGDLVKEDGDEKYIVYEVPIEDPELEMPEDVDLTIEEKEVKIQVPDDLLFDFDESSLKNDAQSTLDDILTEIEALPEGTEIHLNGHTDNEGDPAYNVTLSEERAESVYEYMETNGDIDHLDITLHGYGEEKPIASNEDSESQAKNRRVEMVVNPS